VRPPDRLLGFSSSCRVGREGAGQGKITALRLNLIQNGAVTSWTEISFPKTAAAMLARQDLLAADESSGTCEKRFKSVESRALKRTAAPIGDLLFTPGHRGIRSSGVILFDETAQPAYRRSATSPLPRIPSPAKASSPHSRSTRASRSCALAREKGHEGLDGLRGGLEEYFSSAPASPKMAAAPSSASWVLASPATPVSMPTHMRSARYSRFAEASIVPIVEPEVLLDGDHTIERCYEATEATLAALFRRAARL